MSAGIKLDYVHGLKIYREHITAGRYQVRIRNAAGELIKKHDYIGYTAADVDRRARLMARAAAGKGGAQ